MRALAPIGFLLCAPSASLVANPAIAAEPIRSPVGITIPSAEQEHAWLSLHAFAGRSWLGRRELGGGVVINLPLGRIAQGPGSPTSTHHDEPSATTSPERVAAEPPPRPKSQRHFAPLSVHPNLARLCVRAAWRAHGLDDRELLDRMRARAQSSSLLPETRLGFVRGWDQSYRLSPTDDDPFRLQETTGGDRRVEARLTWRLDRLLFVDDELSMERLRLQRTEARTKLAGRVLASLFDWQRAQLARNDVALDDPERMEAALRQAEAEALLDVLTGGWFSVWLDRAGR